MRKLLGYMGVDRAIAYTLAGRGWGLVSGVITMLMVVRYLTPNEQGYYYTFASLLAMQVLFELGMSVVVMQFASHEMAHLSWSKIGTIEGNENAKSRLRSLLVLVIKWYGIIAALIVVVILPAGWIFFAKFHSELAVSWQFAWVWLIFAAAINIFCMPFLALLEGCGCVTEVARLRMIQNIIGSFFAWIFLIGDGGLLALSAMNSGLALTVLIWLWRTKRILLINLLSESVSGVTVKWKTEIWPFQWRIALSWLSGYFIFQLFTPILFAYRGSVEAGQMGMSISIANALMSIAVAWINTKAPGFGSLVAKKNYFELDRIFALTLSRSLVVMFFIGFCLCAINFILHVENAQLSYRILDPWPFVLLVLATIFAYVTYAQAAYLRAHKEEPFMLISLISAGLIGGLTIFFGEKYGSIGMMSIYASVYAVIGVGCGSVIFFSKKNSWQKRGPCEGLSKGKC